MPEQSLLEQFATKETSLDKWSIPFSMGVFGTLRLNWGNTYLMGVQEGLSAEQKVKARRSWRYDENLSYCYKQHHKAFLPHFYASGLSISCKEGCSAVFEIFTYDAENWKKMIENVDHLESFNPRSRKTYEHGYFRTLVNLRVLPADFESDFYKEDFYHHRSDTRSFDIPQEKWNDYETMPCWVYSSIAQNKACEKLKDSPIIWY